MLSCALLTGSNYSHSSIPTRAAHTFTTDVTCQYRQKYVCCSCLGFGSIEHDILVGLCCFISLLSQFSQAAGFLTVCQTACCTYMCVSV